MIIVMLHPSKAKCTFCEPVTRAELSEIFRIPFEITAAALQEEAICLQENGLRGVSASASHWVPCHLVSTHT